MPAKTSPHRPLTRSAGETGGRAATLPSSRQCWVRAATLRGSESSLGSPSLPHHTVLLRVLLPPPVPVFVIIPINVKMLSAPTHTPGAGQGGALQTPLPFHLLLLQVEHPRHSGKTLKSSSMSRSPVCLHTERGCWGSGCCSGDPQPPLHGAGAAPPSLPRSLPPSLRRSLRTTLLSVCGGKEGGGRREGGRREGGDLPIWLYLLGCLSHAPGGRCGSPRPAERGRLHPAGAARRAGGCPRPSASTAPLPPLRPVGAFTISFHLGFI